MNAYNIRSIDAARAMLQSRLSGRASVIAELERQLSSVKESLRDCRSLSIEPPGLLVDSLKALKETIAKMADDQRLDRYMIRATNAVQAASAGECSALIELNRALHETQLIEQENQKLKALVVLAHLLV